MTEQEKAKEWYSNQQLYEMMVDLSKKLEKTNTEMAKTQTMIRDYNGLRARLDRCEKDVAHVVAAGKGGKEMWGYIVGAIGVVSLIVSMIANY